LSALFAVLGGGTGAPGSLGGPTGLSGGLDPSGGGIQVSTTGFAGTILKAAAHSLEEWILSGTTSLLEACGRALEATTAPSFGGAFASEAGVLERLGAELCLLLLLLGVIQAIVRQDLTGLVRTVLLRLPAALLLGAAVSALVAIALQVTDEMCSALVGSPSSVIGPLVQHVAVLLSGPGSTSVVDDGFAAIVVALLAAGIGLVLWLELVVRSAAIVVCTLFLPVALSGIVWEPSARWARRLAETIAGLVLAKLVVVAVLVLAARTVSSGTGLNGLVQATALLLLATLSPFSLLRLIPMIEAGAFGHLDGLGRRSAGRIAGTALQLGGTLRARAAERSGGADDGGGGTGFGGLGLGGAEGIPMAAGTPPSGGGAGAGWDRPSVARPEPRAPGGGLAGEGGVPV